MRHLIFAYLDLEPAQKYARAKIYARQVEQLEKIRAIDHLFVFQIMRYGQRDREENANNLGICDQYGKEI